MSKKLLDARCRRRRARRSGQRHRSEEVRIELRRLEKGGITNSILHFPAQMIFFTTPELLEIGGVPLVSEREKPTRNEALKYYRKVVGAYKLDVHQYEEVLRIEQPGPHLFRVTPRVSALMTHAMS